MTAATFFAKTKMGWTERVVNKHAKKDGKPFLVDDARQRLIEFHLCRGAGPRRLATGSVPILAPLGDWRGAEPAGAGQHQGRRDQGSTRAGLKLCNVGGTLSVADSTLAFTPLT